MRVSRLFGIDGTHIKRRGGIAAVAGVVAAITGGLALAFAALSAHLALSRHYAPEIAALLVAAGALVIAIIACLVARRMMARARRDLEAQIASSATVALAPAAFSMARNHTKLFAAVAALGAGFWIARRARR